VNSPPWLNTLSTGADVHGVQKTLSNNGLRMENCLLSLTSCHGDPDSVPSRILCTKFRYEVMTVATETLLSTAGDCLLRYDANKLVRGTFAGGWHDSVSPSVSAAAAGI